MALRTLPSLNLAGLCVVCAWFGLDVSAAQAHTVQADGMQPGNYHITVTYSKVRGLPPEMAKNMMSHPHASDGCAETGDINALVQEMMTAGSGMTCSEDHGSASSGVISGLANCQDDRGTSGTLTIKGTYTATHADVSGDLNVKSSLMGAVFEHIHWVANRTGPCP
jgi:Protein of unknown function (DUF3617)